MKRLILSLLFIACGLAAISQEIEGAWNGVLKLPGAELKLVFNISWSEKGYSATMDSPDQGAKGMPVTKVTYERDTLNLTIAALGVKYTGVVRADRVEGKFSQSGQTFDLGLVKGGSVVKPNRPQEPVAPFPYLCEDVTFENAKAGVTLAGTLTMPQTGGDFPVAVMISGSGSQDRNEEIMGHKPFLVIADYLTRHGIAVLRFDDRGFGKSSGNASAATTQDFADDVSAAVEYLKGHKQIDKKKIGLIGHSEGGVIAPMVASSNDDVDFIVMLAGVGIKGDELLLMQKRLIQSAMGVNSAEVEKSQNVFAQFYRLIKDSSIEPSALADSLRNNMKELSGGQISEAQLAALVGQMTSPWFVYFVRMNPEQYLSRVKCPVLAINGSRDLQVPADENLSAIESAVKRSGNKDVTVMRLEALNHLFQQCATGLPAEYGAIEQTFAPDALVVIKDWIAERCLRAR